MILPNIHFQDYPIEFKEINPEDFPHFDVEDKIPLSFDNNGYILDSFLSSINIEEKNTVILNCGVGSGKTTAIINTIKNFYQNENYVVFVASPYLSLVQQYYKDIHIKAEVPVNQIYRHEWIGETNFTYTDKRIHVVTINALLGNPGENSLINSKSKRAYLDNMVNHCVVNNKKVVFIYDEIHDSIHNFKEKFIFNLWRWRNVIHKNFVISATFNESSKVVIEYLAELTNNKIQILEAIRNKRPNNQSGLYLHFDNAKSYKYDNDNLTSIVEDILSRELEIDILSFSKKLCKEILKNTDIGVGKLLFEKYGENINDCTSGLDENERMDRDYQKNRYDKEKCNVGTNFKSGVNIEKDNHALILILPPYTSRRDFTTHYGIFNGGINSVIQAIARKRKSGEIHILLPKPTKFNFESFPFSPEQRIEFENFFEPIQYQSTRPSSNGITDTKLIEYKSLGEQDEILRNFYNNELLESIRESVSHIESNTSLRENKVRLEFPEYKLFKLEDGEKYLAQKFKIFGNDLSGYVSYCAATNQFLNCNWVYSNVLPIQYFKEGNLQYCFEKFYENYFNEDWIHSLRNSVSDKYIYHEIRNEIFDYYQLKYIKADGSYSYIKSFENKEFETQLIAFIQRKLYLNNIEFKKRYVSNTNYFSDFPYTRGEYFRSCISHAINLENDKNLDKITSELVKAYLILNEFQDKIIGSIQTKTILKKEVRYILKTQTDFFTVEEIEKLKRMVGALVEYDYFITNEIFEFKRIFLSSESDTVKLNRFYTYLKNDVFELKTRKIDGTDFDEIMRIYKLSHPFKVLNFISGSKITIPIEAMQNITDISSFGNTTI